LDLLERLAAAREFLLDHLNGRRPHERFRMLIPRGQKLHNGLLQFFDVGERSAAHAFAGQFPKPSLDEIEPTGTGRDITDCDLNNRAANLECGALSNQFGLTNATASRYDSSVTTHRPFSSALMSRRRAISALGAGVGLGFFSQLSASAAPRQARGARAVTFPKGAVIRTILKDLPPDALANGTTLFHEHLDGVYSSRERQLKLPPPSRQDITPTIAEVEKATKDGVVCIVDAGDPDMGVNYDHLRQVSTATGLHVVASGGYYNQNTYPAEISTMSEDQIAESLVKEAAAGRYGAYGEIGDLPGEADFTADERKVYRAVGKAHLKKNLPIFTHNNYGPATVPRDIALRQLDVYESVGVNPRRMLSGHMDSLPGVNPDILNALAKRGAFVGIDRVRGDVKQDENRVKLILAFLEAGYQDHLLLSADKRQDFSTVS
jgi:phosphotriesterase-related protein